MAQHDYGIEDQAGASFLTDLSNLAAAIATNNSGASAPNPAYAYQWWADTASGLLKQRNGANDAWITRAPLADWGIQSGASVAATASGTADALTATFTPAVTALVAGLTLRVRAASANATTTPTFTPNSGTVAAKTIVKGAGSALVAGDIAGAGHWLTLQFDATLDKWVLGNPAVPVASETVRGLVEMADAAEAAAGTDAARVLTPATLRSALNATGGAPIYACRAWVNFNGTGTVAIRASGNVSSVTDNGTGDYTVNFMTATPHTNYVVTAMAWWAAEDDANAPFVGFRGWSNPLTTTSLRIRCANPGGAGSTPAYIDCAGVYVAVFC